MALFDSKNENSLQIRLYVSFKFSGPDDIDYKKQILMTPSFCSLILADIKISMLKRIVEKEYADLFPEEPPMIISKLEDEYGYSLSNTSIVSELLKHGDRVVAIPDSTGNFAAVGNGKIGGNPEELIFLLKSVQQNVISKLADSEINSKNIEIIYTNTLAQGFSDSKVVIHNVATILNKIFYFEDLEMLSHPKFFSQTELLVILIQNWILTLTHSDSFMFNATLDLLDILIKSSVFSKKFKDPTVLNYLMNSSKLEFVSTHAQSRILRIISYLSAGKFSDSFRSKLLDKSRPASRMINDHLMTENPQPRYNPVQTIERKVSSRNSNRFDVNEKPRIREIGNGPDISKGYREETLNLRLPSSQSQGNFGIKANFEDSVVSRNFKKDEPNAFLHQKNNNIIVDYLNLLDPSNAPDIISFALNSLWPAFSDNIAIVSTDSELFLKALNLIELAPSSELVGIQQKLLQTLAVNITEDMAPSAVRKNVVKRILAALEYQPRSLHEALLALLRNILVKGRRSLDVHSIMSLIDCQYQKFQELGGYLLSEISDPNSDGKINYDLQFEGQIKKIMDFSNSYVASDKTKCFMVQTLSNLCLREALRAQILYLGGLDFFFRYLREKRDVEAQRIAAKALLNLSLTSRETKLSIVTELDEEIQKIYNNRLDPIVTNYLQSLLSGNKTE